MKVRTLMGALALVAVTALVTNAVSQDQKAIEEMMAKMGAKMMELGTPGEAHQKIAAKVGKWDMTLSHWMMPGMEAEKSTGTATIEAALDGHYFIEKVDSSFEMEGVKMPFQGLSIMGYDNFKKKYFSTWMDSMSTALATFEGTLSGNTLTSEGMSYCCYTEGLVKIRTVQTEIDADNFKFEYYAPGPDGKEFKSMEIVYKRNGGKNAQ